MGNESLKSESVVVPGDTSLPRELLYMQKKNWERFNILKLSVPQYEMKEVHVKVSYGHGVTLKLMHRFAFGCAVAQLVFEGEDKVGKELRGAYLKLTLFTICERIT